VLALIGGHEIKKKLGDNSYKTFFLHVRV